MTDLETLLAQWETMRKGHQATDEELTDLMLIAQGAKHDHPSVWPRLETVLADHTDLDSKTVKNEVRRLRVTADLGTYPYTAAEFVPAFLRSRGLRMDFSGMFRRGAVECDANYVFNEMKLWSYAVAGARMFSIDEVDSAFSNWQVDEKARLLIHAYDDVAFDPKASTAALESFAAYITTPIDGDPEATVRATRATTVALRNFIYRVKNHMRGRWAHGCHLMPVLVGKQGGAKSHAVTALLRPLADFYSAVSFDIFGDNSKEYDLTTTPIMFFDEMAGIGKTDVEKLKGVMTLAKRGFRQIYGKAVTRTILSTFIGCSNRDISTLIRDETGNRRFLQIDTPNEMDRDTLTAFDTVAIWRCVDEDAVEPPMFAEAADLAAIQGVQADQRHRGLVHEWVLNGDTPVRATKATDLFSENFHPWAMRMYPNDSRFANLNNFRKELERLRKEELPDAIIRTMPGNVVSYRFPSACEPRENVVVSLVDRNESRP